MDNNEYDLKFCEEKLIPIIKSVADKWAALPFEVERKGQGNFVTSADIGIGKDLKLQLHDLVPSAGFIMEENDYDENDWDSGLTWVIDQ